MFKQRQFITIISFLITIIILYFATIMIRQKEIIDHLHTMLQIAENDESNSIGMTILQEFITKNINISQSILSQNIIWLLLLLGASTAVLYMLFKKQNEDEFYIERKKNEAKKLYEEIAIERTIDQSTHLPNRFSLIIDLKDSHIALIDIRNFSSISQTYPASVSQDILIDFFVRIVNSIEHEGFRVFRYDVDIAAISAKSWVYEGVEFSDVCQQIYNEIGFYCVDSIPIRTCVGVCYESDGKQMYGAEIALNIAKKKGDGFFIYHPDKPENNQQNYRLYANKVTDFYMAMKSNNILSFYQPIVDVLTLQTVKYEALVRLRTTDGVLLPSEFLPGVYKFGLGQQMTEQIFKNVWRSAKYINVSMNINLSDVESEIIRNKILNELKNNPKRAKNITFEILETEDTQNELLIEQFIYDLKRSGASIAIDDFGTGYSNFERIMTVWKADIVKVDGSLIRNIGDPAVKSLIQGIVNIAKASGIKTVAEFVADEEIFIAIKECGFDYAQGYYFGKAVPFEYIEKQRISQDNSKKNYVTLPIPA